MSSGVKRVRRKRVRSRAAFAAPLSRHPAFYLSLIFAALIVAALLIIYAPKIYRSWNESRALAQGEKFLRAQKFGEATAAALEALTQHPDSLPAYTILAEATEAENLAETVSWRAQIARLTPNDLASHLNLVSAALRFGELDIARRALDQVKPGDRDKAAYHVVAGWLARAQGNEAEVEQQFAAAVAGEPANDLYQFNLAVTQIHAKDPEKAAKARATLDRLSNESEFRAGALRALLKDAIQRNDRIRADSLAQELQMSGQVTFGDYLLALDFYKKLDAKKFGNLLEKVKPFAAHSPNDLAALMFWMNKNGLASEMLHWSEKLKPAQTTHPPPAVAIAEGFSMVKNWSRLRRWTRDGNWGDAEYLRLAYEAYAARQLRAASADAEFDSLWSKAEHAANNIPQNEAELARLAMKWNLSNEAEQLWLTLSKDPPNRREAFDALAKVYRARNDLDNLLQILRQLHESSPGEIDNAANYARLALLLERNISQAHELARATYEKAPNDLDAAVTYAFSLYGLGRTPEGVEILHKFPREQLHDPHAAVFAAVLLLDENQSEAAREFLEAAQRGPIFEEEKRLLEDARAKNTNSPSASPGPETTPSPSPQARANHSPEPFPKSLLRTLA